MIGTIIYWALLGYNGLIPAPRIPIPNPGDPPGPPDPYRVARIAVSLAGGIAGGYLAQTFIDPSLAVSGLAAFATGRVFNDLSWVMLSPQPLPPKGKEGR